LEDLAIPTVEIESPTPARPVAPRANCQIAFVGTTASEPPRAEVHAWLAKLGRLTAPMTEGRVVIEALDEDHKERRYRVRMDLTMPNGVVTVGHDHPNNGAHEDIYVAIRNAFRAGRRELEAYSLSRGAPAPVELPGSI
jgi:ribosome-associated translation inhibitor RaiA